MNLSPQQRRVLECAAKGMANKQIADELGITLDGVKYHFRILFKALKAPNRTAAVLIGLPLSVVAESR